MNVPANQNLGCNPASVPTAAYLQSQISATNGCGAGTVTVTSADTTNGCGITRIYTISAVDGCGNGASASVTNTWTVSTAAPTISGVPASANLGCNPTIIPTAAQVASWVSADGGCGPATINVTSADTTNGCVITRVYTITASNLCGNVARLARPTLGRADTGPIVTCPTNVTIATNFCQTYCTFTPSDWRSSCNSSNSTPIGGPHGTRTIMPIIAGLPGPIGGASCNVNNSGNYEQLFGHTSQWAVDLPAKAGMAAGATAIPPPVGAARGIPTIGAPIGLCLAMATIPAAS